MNDWRDGLSPEQLAAVEHRDGPLIVLSGPGTGKTRVIVHRVARLIDEGEEPERIVAMTYTKKAAREMRERLALLVGPANAQRVNTQTFHAFGQALVRRFSDLLGLPARTTVIDSAMRKRLLRRLAEDHGLFRSAALGGLDAALDRASAWIEQMGHHATTPDRARAVAAEMRRAADALTGSESLAGRARAEQLAEVASLADLFTDAKRERGWLTYEDLITLPVALLGRPGSFAAEICRADYRRYIIDEFQDINPAQLELLRLLAPSQVADLCVVGDDDQAIYAFRGADDRAFDAFTRHWPSRHVVPLIENRRSVPAIVAASNSVISRAASRFAADKVVLAHPGNTREPWAGIEVIRHSEDIDGALVAARLLTDRLAHPEKEWSHYAILAQSHKDLDAVAAALEFEGVPTVRQRSASASDDQGVLDTLAWARLLAQPQDGFSGCRLLARPPYSINPDDIAGWIRRYGAVLSQARRAHEPAPAFASWLATLDDARLSAFLDRHAELAKVAATENAGEAVFQIIQRADPAHADLPSEDNGRARARRVSALVALARFARGRQERLEQPGSLREFLAYYDDLSASDRSLGSAEDPLESADEPPDAAQGVRLLTAHSSKGLEFDTVLVLRVHPPSGFPKSRQADDGPPDELFGLIDNDSRHADEQRRLFYVACTRARQRLVLFAKGVKKPTGTHYSVELEHDPLASPHLVVRAAAEVMSKAAEVGIALRSLQTPAGAAGAYRQRTDAELLASARADARRAASMALERAGSGALSAPAFDECAQGLADAAARLAIATAVEHHREVEPWLLSTAPRREFHAGLVAGVARARASASFEFARPRPPLNLSFSSIKDYRECPRCWYFGHVLEIPEPPSDRASIGSLVHTVLERWGKLRRDAAANARPEPDAARLDALAFEAIEQQRGLDGDLPPETAHQVRTLIAKAGELDDANANLLNVEHVIRFPYTCDGVTHSLTAKIDRIDQLGDDMRVIDYKTGEPKKYLVSPERSDLQMGIYAMALAWQYASAQERDPGPPVPPKGRAEYWILSTGDRGVIAFESLDLAKVRRSIDEVVRGILRGEFARSNACQRKHADGKSPSLCTMLGNLIESPPAGETATSPDS